jgi:hypothetical protein
LIIGGYIAFLFIGLILGLIGGGGSILGVPVLVYLMCYKADVATTYSLFIVGITSLIGAIAYLRVGEISAEAILEFAVPSLISVFCMRHFFLPAMPNEFTLFGTQITKNAFIMLVFAILIIWSSYSMLRKRKSSHVSQAKWDEFAKTPMGLPFVILLGIAVGCITGFVGAGGGFIIIPVLMFILRLNFKKAIGTSLSIIALNSVVGFIGNIGHQHIDWIFLLSITGMSVLGIIVGSLVSGKVPSKRLKPAFGVFTLSVGIFVLIKELLLK